MKAPVLILFFVLVLVDGTALATSRIIESSPQLITFPCVSASDYLRLLKLTVDQALNSTEVAKEVEAGCLIGLMLEREELGSFGADFAAKYPNVVINPECVASDTVVIQNGTGKRMCLLTVCVTSIAPPVARAHAAIEKNTRQEEKHILHYTFLRTRESWISKSAGAPKPE